MSLGVSPESGRIFGINWNFGRSFQIEAIWWVDCALCGTDRLRNAAPIPTFFSYGLSRATHGPNAISWLPAKPCGPAARKTPPLGGAGFRLPKLSKGTGAAERVRGGPMFRIEWAESPSRTRKPCLPTQLVAVLGHSRRSLRAIK
jgi:hypothetical protein